MHGTRWRFERADGKNRHIIGAIRADERSPLKERVRGAQWKGSTIISLVIETGPLSGGCRRVHDR